jgi:hypothetical protein
MPDLRLGDVIDDFCVKCRRLTNHAIVSLLNSSAAKVRCRTCYSDHDYRNEQAPPSKKELAKQKELYNAVLAAAAGPGAPADPIESVVAPLPGNADDGARADGVLQLAAEAGDGASPSVDGASRPAAKKTAKAARKK